MGAIFKAYAQNAKTEQAIKAQVFVGGVDHGFTTGKNEDYLIIKKKTSMKYDWYMKYSGKVIAKGSSEGGELLGLYIP